MPNNSLKVLARNTTTQGLATVLQTFTQGFLTEQADWDETDKKDKAFIQNKPKNLWSDRKLSGNPLSFKTGTSQVSKETIISMQPIQDLHGYDYPWPAGGGKNILEMTVNGIKLLNTNGTWSENTYTLNDVTFTIQLDKSNNIVGFLVNGTASANTNFIIGTSPLDITSILNGCPAGGSSSSYLLRAYHALDGNVGTNKDDIGNGSVAYTPNRNDYDVRIVIYSNYAANNLLFKPMVRLSTVTDSSYSPYSNICPIFGKTQVSLNGCGKNLYDSQGESTTLNGAIYTVNADKTITVSGTPTGSGTFTTGRTEVSSSLGTVYCGNISKATNVAWSSIKLYNSAYTLLVTLYENKLNDICPVDLSQYPTVKYIALNFKRAQNGVAMSGVIEPMITTSLPQVYEPYQSSNEIAISFPALGVNQWDEEWERGSYDGTTGQKITSNTRIRNKNMIKVMPSTSYYIIRPTTTYVYEYDANKSYLRRYSFSGIFTTSDDCYYLNFNVGSSDSPVTEYGNNISINYPATYTSYEPYINTLYGGTLNLETGVLTVDTEYVDLGTINVANWTRNASWGSTNTPMYSTEFPRAKGASSYGTKAIAFLSIARNVSRDELYGLGNTDAFNISRTKYLQIRSSAYYEDVNSFVTAMSGVQLVYELETPVTYQLTPEQVNLLLGSNTIWTDGDSIDLTYLNDSMTLSDVGNDMDKASSFFAPTEGTTSANAYVVGDYLIQNNQFYKVTAPIAVGDTITDGTNVTATTVGAELKSALS